MDQMNNDSTNMRMVEKKSSLPILTFGGVFLAYSLLFPL